MNYSDGSSPQVAIKAYNRLNEEYLLSPASAYIHRVIIGNNNGKYLMICDPSYSTASDVNAITRSIPDYEQLLNAQKYDFTVGYANDPYLSRYDTKVLILLHPITYNYSFEYGGYVSISVNEKMFTDALIHYTLPGDSTLYLNLGDHIYRLTEQGLIEENDTVTFKKLDNISLPDGAFASNYHDPTTGKKGYAVTRSLTESGCTLTQVISQNEIKERYPFFVGIFIFGLLLIAVICTVMYLILNHVINKPVIMIQNRLKKIAGGDFTRDASIEWNHELGDIGHGINDLSMHIDELMTARIQNEKDKKDLEYKMLQSQINPHFLYNTLNSIKWMAVTQGAEGIAEMTTALSKLLRSISKGTKDIIPIKEELDLVREYFTIQQYRYGSSLTLDISCEEEELLNAQILKFTLQPIVENSIFHGIEPKHTAGSIKINIYSEVPGDTKIVCIAVEDDGVGMTGEQLSHIFDENSADAGMLFKEIGISNIQKRIQYEFGNDYGITAESEPGAYTRMTVRIPFRPAGWDTPAPNPEEKDV